MSLRHIACAFCLGIVGVPHAQAEAQVSRSTDRGDAVAFLRGQRISERNLFSFPTALASLGDKLVVLDFEADTMGFVMDAATGRVLGRFGPAGKNAGELTAPVSVDPVTDSSFWIIDAQLDRATRYRLSGLAGSLRVKADSIVLFPLRNTVPIVGGFLDDKGSFVLIGFFDGPRFARAVPKDNTLTAFGPAVPGDPDDPLRARQHAYQSSLAPHPLRTNFVIGTRYADRLEFFSADGSQRAMASRLREFEPRYRVLRTVNGDLMRPTRDTRFGYLSVTANAHSVFALFSGRTVEEAGGLAWFGAIVERYDWNGVRRQVYGLDEDVVVIAANTAGTKLFALAHGRNRGVVRYSLAADVNP